MYLTNNFYVYAYLRQNGTPYYIGKGSKYRAWTKHKGILVPKEKSRIVIMEHNLTNIGSLALERFYIRWYGRKNNNTGILRNLTDGGEGTIGIIRTEHQKNLQRYKMKGRVSKTKGIKNGMCDLTIYGFQHITGSVEYCTKVELYTKYNLCKVNVHSLFGVNPRQKSVKGWSLIKDQVNHRNLTLPTKLPKHNWYSLFPVRPIVSLMCPRAS